jgi:RNA methyltransferase, TrmH family
VASRRAGESRVYGGSACRALFVRRVSDIIRVYLTEDRMRDFGDLLSTCARLRLPYRIVPPAELEAVTESRHHEGICIVARPRAPVRLEDLVRAPGPACVLGLVGIGNPHNVGAILRTAAHFGVRGAVFFGRAPTGPEDETAAVGVPRLPAAAARTAEGGAEWLDLVFESEPGRALRVLRTAGFTVAATSSHGHGGEPTPAAKPVRALYEAPLPPRLFLLLGAEDTGLPPEVLAAADTVVAIPGTGQVESLNVAAAAAVLLAEHWRLKSAKRTEARAKPSTRRH